MKNSRWGILGLIAVLVIVTGVILIDAANHNSAKRGKALAKVGSHVIYQDELSSYTGTTYGSSASTRGDNGAALHLSQSDSQVLSELMDHWLYQQIMDKYNLSVDQSKVNAEIDNRMKNGHLGKGMATLAVENDFYQEAIQNAVVGFTQGKYVIAHTDQHLPFFKRTPNVAAVMAQNQAQISADQQQAQNFINDIYSKLQSNQVSFDQAVNLEVNDPTLGSKAHPNYEHSGAFNTAEGADIVSFVMHNPFKDTLNNDLRSTINGIQVGQYSKPLEVKGIISDPQKQPQVTAPIDWIIVKVEKRQNSIGSGDATAFISQQKNKLGYAKYV